MLSCFEKGYVKSEEHKKKISATLKQKGIRPPSRLGKIGIRDEKVWCWKGDEVGKSSLHSWARRRIKKPDVCERCKKAPPYDMANISQQYKRDVTDWEWLCRRCHMEKDGRLHKPRRRV